MTYKFKESKGSAFRGKYCTRCNSVWELNLKSHHLIVGIVKHPDFPSFGLEREQCPSCKEPPRSFKELPGTLARERHKKLLQRISTNNQKLLKKNVEKQRG